VTALWLRASRSSVQVWHEHALMRLTVGLLVLVWGNAALGMSLEEVNEVARRSVALVSVRNATNRNS
jgi:hypothetical protein